MHQKSNQNNSFTTGVGLIFNASDVNLVSGLGPGLQKELLLHSCVTDTLSTGFVHKNPFVLKTEFTLIKESSLTWLYGVSRLVLHSAF